MSAESIYIENLGNRLTRIDLTEYDFIKEHLIKLIDDLQVKEDVKQRLKNSMIMGLKNHNMYRYFSDLFSLNKKSTINNLIQGLSNYLNHVLDIDNKKERIIGLYFAGVWLADIVFLINKKLPCIHTDWDFDIGSSILYYLPFLEKLFNIDHIDQIIPSKTLNTRVDFFLKKLTKYKEYTPNGQIEQRINDLINVINEKIYQISIQKEPDIIKP